MQLRAPDTHSINEGQPLLFLSHAGIDSAAAARLKRRIEESEAARTAGLKVWFDKDDLRPGEDWQAQLEAAVAQSTAFAVYVGSSGVMNWVQAEVRLALNRANTESSYRFIPILASGDFDAEALPGFARRFQGVANPEEPAQFQKLMTALLGAPAPVRLEENPFFGLRAIDEGRDHLFFGREKETQDLVELVRRNSLVLVSGDSGSGKSSLVRAGLVPRFRGGALDSHAEDPQSDTIHHAIVTRPSADPWRQLGEAVERAAKQMGLSLPDQGTLAGWARNRADFAQVRQGLRCNLDPAHVQVLLIVDQFEELLTLTPESERERFVAFLLDLATPPSPQFRVVLTMRHDYVNLITAFPNLCELLNKDDRKARFLLGRMSDAGLKQIVCEPLLLAGVADQGEREALAKAVLRDVGQRPGDLALVQMALTETWLLRHQYDGDLLLAYSESGRVEGALAKAAEKFLQSLASDEERARLDDILVRLIRIGETRGATRRIATRDEFDDTEWEVLQKLASVEGKRLVLIGGGQEMPTIEIAHEALVSAWPHFQTLLHGCGPDKFVLDELTPRAKAWVADARSAKRLATGAELDTFRRLAERRKGWLSIAETDFVNISADAEEQRLRRDLLLRRGITAAAIVMTCAFAFAFWEWRIARDRQMIAESREFAERGLSTSRRNPELGLLEAEDAFKRSPTTQAEKALRQLLVGSLARVRMDHKGPVGTAAFSRDGKRIVTTSGGKAQVWDAATGNSLGGPLEHSSVSNGSVKVLTAAFSPESSLIITGATDGRARIWRKQSPASDEWVVDRELPHGKVVASAALSPGNRFAATGGADGRALIWDLASGQVVHNLLHQDGGRGLPDEWAVSALEFDSTGEKLVSASGELGWIWDIASEAKLKFPHRDGVKSVSLRAYRGQDYLMTAGGSRLMLWDPQRTGHQTGVPPINTLHASEAVRSAVLSDDHGTVAVALANKTVQVWQAIYGVRLAELVGHTDNVNSVDFSPDGHFAVTASDDKTARVWSTEPEDLTPLITTVRAEKRVANAAFSPQRDRLVVAADWEAELWDTVGGHRAFAATPSVEEHSDQLRQAIVFEESGEVADVQFDARGERVATATPTGAAIWSDHRLSLPLASLPRQGGSRGVRFNRAGDRLLTWSGATVCIWNIDTIAPGPPDGADPPTQKLTPAKEENFSSEVLAAAFAVDADSVLVVTRSALVVWDPLRDKRPKPQAADEASFNCAGDSGAQNCTATVVATVASGSVKVWRLANNAWEVALEHPAAHAALSADGEFVAALTSDYAEVLSTRTGKRLGRKMHTRRNGKEMLVAAFSPDNELLATGRARGTVDIWVKDTGERATKFKDESEDVTGIAFSRDKRFLLTTSAKTARIHRRERFEPMPELEKWVAKRVTRQELEDYKKMKEDDE